jgi:hypothetical protein
VDLVGRLTDVLALEDDDRPSLLGGRFSDELGDQGWHPDAMTAGQVDGCSGVVRRWARLLLRELAGEDGRRAASARFRELGAEGAGLPAVWQVSSEALCLVAGGPAPEWGQTLEVRPRPLVWRCGQCTAADHLTDEQCGRDWSTDAAT